MNIWGLQKKVHMTAANYEGDYVKACEVETWLRSQVCRIGISSCSSPQVCNNLKCLSIKYSSMLAVPNDYHKYEHLLKIIVKKFCDELSIIEGGTSSLSPPHTAEQSQ